MHLPSRRVAWLSSVVALVGCASAEAPLGASDAGAEVGPVPSSPPPPPATPLDDGGAVDPADAGPPLVVGPVGCVTSVAAGHHAFACAGVTYDVELSSTCARGGCGVIVDVHGLSMSAALQDKSTGLRAKASAQGFVVVQPTAPAGPLGPSWTPGADDAKVWAFLGELRRALAIDPKRVHFTGFSQGGAMTWRMVCAHAGELASAAPIAAANGTTLSGSVPPFALDCPFDGRASPAAEVPILQMHGTKDALVPFAKGLQQRDAAVAAWSLGAPVVVSSDALQERTRYVSPKGTAYEFLRHDGEVTPPLFPLLLRGHCVPGGADQPGAGAPGQTLFFSCKPPTGVAWGDVVLRFFQDHPRP